MTNKKIILVEDDAVIRKMYELAFKQEGFKILTYQDGELGLNAIIEKKPDLVLLDVVMPKLNGFEVLEKLKEKGLLDKIKVIMLTNLGQEEDIKKALEIGAKDYIVKSDYTTDKLIKKIKNFLK